MTVEPLAPGMVPYLALFPKSKTGMLQLMVTEKVGKARVGGYLVVEHFCIMADCDCRQVIMQLLDEKGRQAAVINFPLDIDRPFGFPALNEDCRQSQGAEDLLEIVVEALEKDPAWFKGLCRRYRAVRKKITGVAYEGPAFPPPGPIAPDWENEEDLEAYLNEVATILSPEKETDGPSKSTSDSRQGVLFDEFEEDFPSLANLLAAAQGKNDQGFSAYQQHQDLVRICLNRQADFGEELAGTLVDRWVAGDDEGIDVALGLLVDALEVLRVDLERRRPATVEKMESLQQALARHIYAEGVDVQLGTEVTGALLSSRVEILPVLHQAHSRRVEAGLDDFPPEMSVESAVAELLDNLNELEVNNTFELADALLQMLAVGEAEAQISLSYELLLADSPLARDAAVLTLFHPRAEVRDGVAEMLAQVDGRLFTPESLRRMILSRNWFPAEQRTRIDRAIAHARQARIDCAPLAPRPKVKSYASGIDGAGAQMLLFVVPQGQGYLACAVMLKEGAGVADSWLAPLPDKRELKHMLKMFRQESGCIESSRHYLDRRICQALSQGAAAGGVPGHWLVAIAEILGCDQWRALPFAADAELAELDDQLAGSKKNADQTPQAALKASADWPEKKTFAHSWFEDDAEVDDLLDEVLGEEECYDPMVPLLTLFEGIFEPRRGQWRDRLIQTAAWLKAAQKPPVPWQQMTQVAAAVADPTKPLREIPLMIAVAENTVGAYFGRLVERE